jgi:hypothetical protein
VGVSLFIFALVFLTGCATKGSVQDSSTAHQKIVFASAYSAEECQPRMNDLTHNEVHLINESRRLATSIFSLGIVPSHSIRTIVGFPVLHRCEPTKLSGIAAAAGENGGRLIKRAHYYGLISMA